MPTKMPLDAYRDEMLANSRRTLTMISGDPNVTDKDDANHYLNSVMGRLDRLEDNHVTLEEKTGQAVHLVKAAVEQLREEVRTETFGWTQVYAFTRKHWFKLATLVIFGLYFAYGKGWLSPS